MDQDVFFAEVMLWIIVYQFGQFYKQHKGDHVYTMSFEELHKLSSTLFSLKFPELLCDLALLNVRQDLVDDHLEAGPHLLCKT